MTAAEGLLTALERNWEMVDVTLQELDDATLARCPSEQCNSMAWLLWHMTRVLDTFVHTRLQAQPQIEAANPAPAADTTAKPQEAPPSQPPDTAAKVAPQEQAAAPQDAFAKARDADLKRAAEKRKAERRQQQWADQRRYQLRRDDEPRDVERNAKDERNVREEPEPRQFIERPVRLEFPRIRLFGPSDDDEQ